MKVARTICQSREPRPAPGSDASQPSRRFSKDGASGILTFSVACTTTNGLGPRYLAGFTPGTGIWYPRTMKLYVPGFVTLNFSRNVNVPLSSFGPVPSLATFAFPTRCSLTHASNTPCTWKAVAEIGVSGVTSNAPPTRPRNTVLPNLIEPP